MNAGSFTSPFNIHIYLPYHNKTFQTSICPLLAHLYANVNVIAYTGFDPIEQLNSTGLTYVIEITQ